MSETTSIAWTNSTWNPVRGCSIVSKGCTNCYAMKQAHRFAGAGQAYDGLTKMTRGGPVWTGQVRLVPELLDWPLRRRKPLRIFVNSMSDLFHEDVPDRFIADVFAAMEFARELGHIFQILTKRPGRMQAAVAIMDKNIKAVGYPQGFAGRYPHVWLGVSVEDQAAADERVPLLLQTPAAVRFASYEPALEAVDWAPWLMRELTAGAEHPARAGIGTKPYRSATLTSAIDWIIVGGESGSKARLFDLAWARSTVGQCRASDVPVFCKQVGSNAGTMLNAYGGTWEKFPTKDRAGADPVEWPEDLRIRQFPEDQQ